MKKVGQVEKPWYCILFCVAKRVKKRNKETKKKRRKEKKKKKALHTAPSQKEGAVFCHS